MTKKDLTKIKAYESDKETKIRQKIVELFKNCPIPDDQLMPNLGLFINSKNLSRILFMDHIFKLIVDVPGAVFEFGTRWGQNVALFSALRGIYDPFNRHRKIVGFDTFTGFPEVSLEDGKSEMMQKGNLILTKDYYEYLAEIMEYHEQENPLSHIKKYELIKGDANLEIITYFKEHPETIVALAFFDFDIYKPTKKCLQTIKPHLVKGSILCFDELNDPDSPGETMALDEVFGLNNIHLKRHRFTSRTSYFVVE
ncbi:MAG: crotonobetainyl-CoA--carnitine CoA-transferase [Candidatus Levybacteria bacterium RIFCSPHIGHO2_12_FULL_38_12]|nr:MAG: crotonobetainyl-CoA--carnitine CoA-transferase [Candidatus Levybacteria bacterium RIFCSPHIGHO2_01_FULL_38_12]OGH21732.1 MAG: crotonobetainyl-CoA--carnitine CoA-transferase [Candidatus Levybacteria bacterium RIFCSPHIGHO2_02_FULL_37_18]OGH22610.1 MAG: crotonobetainyl-CoA--carnitine CoA-transferase [Candidatus Levybacteria bacterium RIFCSPHIGHO2_12_FULL_38_12]OGH33353.1 MAG: crotonobetainyl-CoA--carnitine CoA-transferase [Candidatus Levybacteria bacterium RIFCSPLOWO2_01_FULL_37_20]OGH43742